MSPGQKLDLNLAPPCRCKESAQKALSTTREKNNLKEEPNEESSEEAEPQIAERVRRERILSLYEKSRPGLLRYLCSESLKRDQAEEVIQETFMRLTSELNAGKEIQNEGGWAIRVAKNLAADAVKRTGKDSVRLTPLSMVVLATTVDPNRDPEELYLQKERSRRLEIAISKLNLQQQQCFRLRAAGYRYKDIGHALGISEQRAVVVVKQAALRIAEFCR